MFDVATAADLYAMLVQDFDDFVAEQHSARRALHCAVAAYHLHEWTWGDWLKDDHATQATLRIRSCKEFLSWISNSEDPARSACLWFHIVQALTNGTKHFAGRGQGFATMRVVAVPYGTEAPGSGEVGGTWGGPVAQVFSSHPIGPQGQGYLLLDFGEEAGEYQYKPVAEVLEVVVRFWRDFYRAYRPDLNVPASRHHPF